MRRRLLLLGGLTCALGIAVLLRTAAPDVEPIVAGEPEQLDVSAVADVMVEDCSIATEVGPGLASREAAQLVPSVSANTSDISVSPNADDRSVAFRLEGDFKPPRSPVDLFRETIRPPPTPHIS